MGRRRKFTNRYEVIVETAAKLFSEKGFEGATMDEIARACDLGKATIYAEFSSKEDLMQAVIIKYIQESIAAMKSKIESTHGHYLATLQEILFERVMGIYERANRHFHSTEILMAARLGASDKTAINQYREEEIRVLASLLENAALNHEIKPYKSYVRLARLIRKGLTGLYPPHIFGMTRQEYEEDVCEVIDIFLSGLKVDRLGHS